MRGLIMIVALTGCTSSVGRTSQTASDSTTGRGSSQAATISGSSAGYSSAGGSGVTFGTIGTVSGSGGAQSSSASGSSSTSSSGMSTGADSCHPVFAPLKFVDDGGRGECHWEDGGVSIVDLRIDSQNCGACGFVCATAPCDFGFCLQINAGDEGLALCEVTEDGGMVVGQATQLSRTDNCGGCGCRCNWGWVCGGGINGGVPTPSGSPWAGVCVLEDPTNCPSGGKKCGWPDAGSLCVDTQYDLANCGDCGNHCFGGSCDNGNCTTGISGSHWSDGG